MEWIEKNYTCDSCRGGKKVYLGKCYPNCKNGKYTDNKGEKYYCFDERCKKCTEFSIREGLCTECNKTKGYFRKYEDREKEKYECFQTLEGYYKKDYIYKNNRETFFDKCYESCQTCITSGNEQVHNCLTCNINNTISLRKKGYLNCYPNCTHNLFYFDRYNNYKYTCTNSSSCPLNYPLKVEDIGLCVKSCRDDTDNQYQYEFKGHCFPECPVDSELSDVKRKICKLNCPFERPFALRMNCVSNCTINERSVKDCETNYFGNRTNAEI